MSIEQDLEEALREINRRAGAEEGLGSGRFTTLLNNRGGVGAAKYSLRPQARRVGGGFDAIMTAGRPDLTLEYVVLQRRFRSLFEPNELAEAGRRLGWLEEPTVAQIAAAIEAQAHDHPFGTLQQLRQRLKGLTQVSSTIFKGKTIFPNYAFHYGGRTELQFNLGFEELDDGKRYLRHGVAISLQRSPAFHAIDDAMLGRIERFNEFIGGHADELSAFRMYHQNDADKENDWSGDYMVREITPEIVKLGMFIFLGRRQGPSNVSIELILRDFDLLLPMYEFVEGGAPASAMERETPYEFIPGLTKRPSSVHMTVTERRLNKDLRHNDLQYALGRYLAKQYGEERVRDELPTGNGTKIDLVLKHDAGLTFYEIKIAATAQSCIRQALGQLMEYSYWPGAREAKKLIIIGEERLDKDAQKYLGELRKRFSLPVEYQQFDMRARKLVS